MNPKETLISLGLELSEEQNRALDLWAWLPSYKAAQAGHGDESDTVMPCVSDILTEATLYISHHLNPTPEQIEEAGDYYKCPCGEDHTQETQ